jgi:DNA-directed RNA polymerase specialized sigma24 family protein
MIGHAGPPTHGAPLGSRTGGRPGGARVGLMQPPIERAPAVRPPRPVPHGDEDELYRRHHRDLRRAVAHAIGAPRELIEDACQAAWTMLLVTQPERYAIFPWLRVVAIHEAYRLSAVDRRDARLERLRPEDGDWQDVMADPRTLDDAVEALEALRALAALPERQRIDLAMKISGHSYVEIARAGGRSYTNVNKSLVKARRRIRDARHQTANRGR